MSNAIVTAANGIDQPLQRLIPWFGNGNADDRWRCELLEIESGPAPKSAKIVMRNTPGAVSEAFNSMAFNFDNTKWLKAGSRAGVDKVWLLNGVAQSQTIFTGTVVTVYHDRDDNALVAIVLDDRWLMQSVRIVGRWISPGLAAETTGGPWYQMGWPVHFNPGGRPNCIWAGGVPYFTPYADWGSVDGTEPPDPEKHDQNVASYWTISSILLYLWNFYSASGYAATSNLTKKFPWIALTPGSLIWPKDFANNLDGTAAVNFNNAIGQGNQNLGAARKGRELVLDGFDILSALHYILQTAGGWTIGFNTATSIATNGATVYSNVLSAISSRWTTDSDGVSIPFAQTGAAKDNFKQAVINGGSFGEDASNYASAIAGAGQLVFIERLFSMDPGNLGTYQAAPQIVQAWTQDRFNLFKSIVGAQNGPWTINGQSVKSVSPGFPGAATFDQACRLLPEVMTQWKLEESYDFQTGTVESGMPRAEINRPSLPHLLSLLSDAGGYDFAGLHTPVYVEVQTAPSTPKVWVLAGYFDGFEILDNGNLIFPNLRGTGHTWSTLASDNAICWAANPNTPADGPSPADYPLDANGNFDILPLNIRIALAVPCDHRINQFSFCPSDPIKAGQNPGLQYNDNPDQDRIDPTLIRRDYKDLQKLYALWRRANSASRPQSQNYPLDADATLRDDTALLQQHITRAMWDKNRLQKTGMPRIDGYLVTSYPQGMAVQDFIPVGGGTPVPVRCVLSGYRLHCKQDGISTELKFIA